MNKLSRAEVAELCGCRVQEIPRDPVYSLTSFTPPGPVCAAYIRSQGPIDAITGPSGSGKTVGTIFKLARFSVQSVPVTKAGVVKVQGFVLRDNYRALYRTTLRSWFNFFPPDYPGSSFFGGQDRPAQHRLKLSTVRPIDGVLREVPVDLNVDFFAVGDVAIEELLKGYEATWGWASEGDLLHDRVIPFAYDRTGRYPSLDELPPGTKRPRMMAVDFNPPAPNHPLWRACTTGSFQKSRPDDPLEAALQDIATAAAPPVKTVNFFHQPSGLSPEGENRAGKTLDEYTSAAATMTENDVRRFVHGLPGYAHDGKPVYVRDFRRRVHVAQRPLVVLPGLPLHIGFDQGMSPAAVLFQVSLLSQVRVLRELFLGQGVGYGRFLQALIPLLTTPPLRDLPPGAYTADPAGFYGADKVAGELAWAQTISAGLGHAVYPAATNEPATRIEAVRLRLSYQADADTPGLIIDPSCEMLIDGFEADYKYPRLSEKAAMEFGDAPVKNRHANLHDALQYGILGVFGAAGVIAEAARAGRPENVVSLYRPGDRRSADEGWTFSPF